VLLFVLLLTINPFVAAQGADAPKAASGKVVNINTAGQSELETLPGIGPSLAQKIVEFRTKNGNFKAASDLMAVPGIGEKKYESLKSMITVK
jgi:competence protein ComEA